MKFKLCLTFLLMTLAVICLAATILLVPMLLLPALLDSRIDYYDPVPAKCKLNQIQVIRNWKKCRVWQSCRQGCSSTQDECYRIFVDYRLTPKSDMLDPFSPTEDKNATSWTETVVPLLINPDSCGDFPEVDCEYFVNRVKFSEEFACYISQTYPRNVVMQFAWRDTVYPLSLAIGLPLGLFMVFALSCCTLCFWSYRDFANKDAEELGASRKYAFE